MIYIILPAFNEAPNMKPLFTSLKEHAQSIGQFIPILVDDGSSDDTVAIASQYGKDLGLQIVKHEHNQGLGAAILTGLKTAISEAKDTDIIVMLDADNSHNPNHIPGMTKLIAMGNDLVIASRYQDGGQEVGLVYWRSIGSRLISIMLTGVFDVNGARDYTCGYRAYTGKIIRQGFEVYKDDLISETSFVCMAELLVKLYSVGAKIAEYPLILRYDLKQGTSKMDIPKTLWRYAHLVFKQGLKINWIHWQHVHHHI
jgi:dolichol-phosphate mannosyltransferase